MKLAMTSPELYIHKHSRICHNQDFFSISMRIYTVELYIDVLAVWSGTVLTITYI